MQAKYNNIKTIEVEDGKTIDVDAYLNNTLEESKQEEIKIKNENIKKKEQKLIKDAKIVAQNPFDINQFTNLFKETIKSSREEAVLNTINKNCDIWFKFKMFHNEFIKIYKIFEETDNLRLWTYYL